MRLAADDSWSLIPEQVQHRCLLGLTAAAQGSKAHAAPGCTARLVCGAWRHMLDGSATEVALHDWPPPGACPIHQLFPRAQAVSLLALPRDTTGGRLQQLAHSLQQLPSLTRLELSWNTAVAAHPPVITQCAESNAVQHAAPASSSLAAATAAAGAAGPVSVVEDATQGAQHAVSGVSAASSLSATSATAARAAAAAARGLRVGAALPPAPTVGAADVGGLGVSASATVSVNYPTLPSCLSRLHRLAVLSIRSPPGRLRDTVAADAVCGWELPAELAALTGLTCLVLEAVVPPRRHLSRLENLQHLRITGWMTVTKTAVHLHRLPALTHLTLSLATTATEQPEGLEDEEQLMEASHLGAVVMGELKRRATLVKQAQPEKQQQKSQQRQQQDAQQEDALGATGCTADAVASAAALSSLQVRSPMRHLQSLTLAWPDAPPSVAPDAAPGSIVGWAAAADALGGALTSLELTGRMCRSAQLCEGLEHLTGLAVLTLRGHHLPALCLPWAKLRRLTNLTAERNSTSSIDAGISCLTGLQELSVQLNRIKALPAELAACSRLVRLGVGHNSLSRLPPEMTALRLLQDLDVSHCLLVDSCFALDGPLTALTALTRLQLQSNRLQAPPAAALALPNLQLFSLGHNYYAQQLAGVSFVPGVLPGLRQLEWAGPAPGLAVAPAVQQWIGSCRWLRALCLKAQDIQQLQPELFQLNALEELDVSHNKLTSLPEDLGRLTALTCLQLIHNRLPALPASITRLGCLVHLACQGNCLGQLPEGMSRMQQLTTIDVFHNTIHTLPSEWWRLPSLRVCDVGVNYPLKALPSSWGQRGALPKLQLLRVSHLLRDDPVLLHLQQRGVEVKVARGLEHKLFAGDEGDVLPGMARAGAAAAAAAGGGDGGGAGAEAPGAADGGGAGAEVPGAADGGAGGGAGAEVPGGAGGGGGGAGPAPAQ